jgi:adenylate cyclase
MNSALRNKRLLRILGIACLSLILAVSAILFAFGTVWTEYDFKTLDFFYRKAVSSGHGPKQSPQVLITTISDKAYDYFGKNVLDRTYVADLNDALGRLDVAAVGYDLIFARPSNPEADERLTSSLRNLGSVFLPVGLGYVGSSTAFHWEKRRSYEQFRTRYLRKPQETGKAKPYYATRALMQWDDFAAAALNSGHISSFSDPDGVYRHMIMLLKVDDAYFPTLSLSMFLQYSGVPFEKLIVEWGRRIVIPATGESLLEKDVVIPIDDRGRAFIPFPGEWDHCFKQMESDDLLEKMKDENLRGNLTEMFEGKLVLVGDISVGASDLGQTPLESQAPLLLLHAAVLNGMLTNCFYARWSFGGVLGLIWAAGILLGLAAFLRSSWFLYGTGFAVIAGIVGFAWIQFVHFRLFPVATVGGSAVIILFGLVASIEVVMGRERSFIKNAFSRYAPQELVDILISDPEMLKLGGEERIMTVLFSDLADFTSISERTNPSQLVHLLMEYLTEMTDIIHAHGGIIDKFEGDAIMAEFGAPLPMPDHADRAVRAALRMQERLKELREIWGGKGLPALKCRIGINTGSMIVGNMGSKQVFDYTVLGDSVNLASRLEAANKRYNTHLMISEFTFQSLTPGIFRTRILDAITVKGKSKSVRVFEVYGETSDPGDPENELYHAAYREAFELYFARNFEAAGAAFRKALELRPGDPASKQMIERVIALNPDELPPDWDGSIVLHTK